MLPKLNIIKRGIHIAPQQFLKIYPVLFETSTNYGYSKEEQKSWEKLYPSCAGRHQSPIAINSCSVEAIGMHPLKMIGYDNSFPGEFTINNNGHTVSISLTQDDERPTICGGLLKNNYEFQELHFHWSKNYKGSEHIIDNMQYPLEMHLVHKNIKYKTKQKALKYKDGISVVAVFFNISEESYPPFDSVVENFFFVQEANSSCDLKCGIKLSSLLPTDTEFFYTYKGSLTTPPCSESVIWILFPKPVMISNAQLSTFRLLKNKDNKEISENIRKIQPILNRKVYIRNPNIIIPQEGLLQNIKNFFTGILNLRYFKL